MQKNMMLENICADLELKNERPSLLSRVKNSIGDKDKLKDGFEHVKLSVKNTVEYVSNQLQFLNEKVHEECSNFTIDLGFSMYGVQRWIPSIRSTLYVTMLVASIALVSACGDNNNVGGNPNPINQCTETVIDLKGVYSGWGCFCSDDQWYPENTKGFEDHCWRSNRTTADGGDSSGNQNYSTPANESVGGATQAPEPPDLKCVCNAQNGSIAIFHKAVCESGTTYGSYTNCSIR